MKNLFDLEGKTVLITGGAGILGKQHARALADHGATVIVADINQKAAKEFCSSLNEEYSTEIAHAEYMDVLNKSSIEIVCDKYDRIDILINNAAKDTKVEKKGDLNTNIRFETMSYDHWKSDMQVGLDGCFLCSQVVANKMAASGGGNIINIAYR